MEGSSPAASDRYLRQALIGLIGLKLKSGASMQEVKKLVAGCIDAADSERSFEGEGKGLDIHRLASVLRAWHKETKYLTQEGLPAALPRVGKLSLESLVGTHYPTSKIEKVVVTLARAGLIRRQGRGKWLPTAYHAQMSANTQEILDHVSEGVSRFLETVLNNISTPDKTKILFEQSCKVRHLPSKHRAEFREVVRQQAMAFLTAVDDWLEARVVNTKEGRRSIETCSAGVFTFAYLDEPGES